MSKPDTRPHALAPGMLLVATPALLDPNFADTVVMLIDTDDGALGVVLNRPSEVLVEEVLPPWQPLVAEPRVLFRGGPVATDGALGLAGLRDPDDAPVGYRPVTQTWGLLDLDTPVELVAGSLTGLRIFAGYAGWSAGQLEAEVAEDSWDVVPGFSGDVFDRRTEGLWKSVLRRQPGERAWRSTRPLDPELN